MRSEKLCHLKNSVTRDLLSYCAVTQISEPPLTSNTMPSAHFTVRIAFRPVLKSPNFSRVSLKGLQSSAQDKWCLLWCMQMTLWCWIRKKQCYRALLFKTGDIKYKSNVSLLRTSNWGSARKWCSDNKRAYSEKFLIVTDMETKLMRAYKQVKWILLKVH